MAYVGYDPRVRDSGQPRGRRFLSKRGPAELRRLPVHCAAFFNILLVVWIWATVHTSSRGVYSLGRWIVCEHPRHSLFA
jgi:Transposase IS116/IS110/IS902 family